MENFAISTDSNSDFYADEIKKYGIYVGRLKFTISKDKEFNEFTDDFTSYEQYVGFYNALRKGALAKTSILNLQSHIDLFTKMAEDGVVNALHIAQSAGLSPTIDNANKAIEIVKQKYPNINYIAIESSTTTIGEQALVEIAMHLRDQGKTNQQTANYINSIKNNIQHFIIADDLKYLCRGGRVSTASAIFGSLLQIKPIIEFSRSGKLVVTRKIAGLNKALKFVVDNFSNFTLNKEFPIAKIVHTDNLPLAEKLQSMIFEKYGIKPEIRIMGPIIGAHVGPGSVAFGFVSEQPRSAE